ncbi:hypothetical protein HMI54_004377 [Coelomomyces lativittatus]|nr:hypothetical protein HMI55_005654 [Coelomomyces lativittatus]KAJ1507194.1 hypothetical protein HMI54_004377 [Coelomomyces lativittatus]
MQAFRKRSTMAGNLNPKIGEVEKLKSLMIMVGDKPVQAVAMVHDVANLLVKDYQTHMSTILKTFTGW